MVAPAQALTGSSLIKALKASSDPPTPGGARKVELAAQAWADVSVTVPRKADVVRDFILEQWTRGKPGPKNAIVESAYHDLLVSVTGGCAAPAAAPLSLLATYISSVAATGESVDIALAESAAQSLPLLFAPQKAEAWAESWGKLVTALASPSVSSAAMAPAAQLVCESLAAALPTSPNTKKIATSLHPLLQEFAATLYYHQALRAYFEPLTSALFFPLTTLQTVEPLKVILNTLSSTVPTDLAPSLALVPHLFGAYIDALATHKYALWRSDRAPVDVVIADRTRAAVIPAANASLDLLNRLEDAALARPSTSASAPSSAKALWAARLALWERVLRWGGYLESDERGAALVAAEGTRAATALAMYAASESTATEEGLAGLILRTLDALERLDHARAALGTDVVGWCLAAPERAHVPARTVLLSLLRFHGLTHSLPQFFALLGDAVNGLFDPSLPQDTLEPLYALVAGGPLAQREFRDELSAAVRGVNIGGRRGTAWAGLLSGLGERVNSALDGEASAGGKRKRHDGSESGARVAAVLSRLSKIVLDAGARARAGDIDVEAAIDAVVAAFGDEIPEKSEGKRKKRKSDVGARHVAGDLVLAAGLRVARSARLIHREEEYDLDATVLAGLLTGDAQPELRLEIFHYLFTALALTPQHPSREAIIDALLDALSGSAKRAWDGKDVGVSDKTLAAACWTISAEHGLALLDVASTAAQLDTLTKTIIKRADGSLDGLSVAAAIKRTLHNAETWELPALRSALLRSLGTEKGAFVVLSSAPVAWLSKTTRATLLNSAYEADAAGDVDTRVAIRTWLARLALSADVLGPLDAEKLSHLVKTGGETSELALATLPLIKAAYAHFARPGSDSSTLATVLEANTKKFKWKDMDFSCRAAAALLELSPEKFAPELRDKAVKFAESVRKYLRPAVDKAMEKRPEESPAVFVTYRSLLRFSSRLDIRVIPDDVGLKLVKLGDGGALGTPSPISKLEPVDLQVVALELVALGNKDPLPVLASYIVLSRFQIGTGLDTALASWARTISSDDYAMILQALVPIIAQKASPAALTATAVLLAAPVEGSGKVIASQLHGLLRALERAARVEQVGALRGVLGVLGALVEDRTGLLRAPDAALVLSILADILLPSSAPTETHPDLIPVVIAPLMTIARHRADLALAHLPSLVGVLASILPLLQRARTAAKNKLRRPWWFASDPIPDAAEAHAALLGRVIVSLSTSKLSTASDAPSRTLAGPLAKHAPLILVTYARCASDPWASLSTGVRRALEEGLFALCDVVTAGGRADGRGREGEGVGVSFGLGEANGDAERGVWAELWTKWGRKRYTGRG